MVKPVDTLFKIDRKAVKLPDGNWQVMVTPPQQLRLPTTMVVLSKSQYLRYLEWGAGRMMIQEALPELSAADREILLTGIGNEDFQQIAREDEE